MRGALVQAQRWLKARRLLVTVVVGYLAGVAWRLHHITVHDPRTNVYSDMALYMTTAKRLVREGYELQPFDVLAPPGMSWTISKILPVDPDLNWLVALQFVLSVTIPLVVGALAWVAFDRRTAAWSVLLSSASYFYVEYASFFLTEIYMMFLVPLVMALYLLAAKSKPVTAALIGAVAGLTFFVALAFKMVALPAILGFCGIHWLFTRGGSLKIKTIALSALCLAAAPGILAMIVRCTEGNQGEPCFGSNKSAADFLLGHYGRIHSLAWSDAQFGSPGAQHHGYMDKPRVGFSITDSHANSDAAWDWIDRHELPAAVLSVQHVTDMLGPNAPWPVIWTNEWPMAQGYQYFFYVFVMFPTLLLCFDLARSRGVIEWLRSTEFAILSTIFGASLAVFIATGETRYRLPFDCVFIVLAVRFYIRLWERHASNGALRAPYGRTIQTKVPEAV